MATPDAVRLTYDSIGSFLVEDGTRIVCDPIDEAAEQREFFRRLIENELLGLVLHQRDHLVLHASAVSVDGKAVTFLGPRGAGKSTTAAAFDAAGYSVLEDDVVAIRLDENGPMVVPGVPQLRLESDAATTLGLQGTTTPSEESWYKKQMLPIEEVPETVPLTRCYVLTETDELEVHRLPGSEQLLSLVTQRYVQGLLSESDQPNIHIEQCSRVVEHAGVRVLARPLNHSLLPELVETVVNDIRQGTPEAD
ncbi:hypothetical protein [Halorubrum kocurii]|uniref:HPr kinase n=1 Tax=Halorubrum kocurii JCM 14978 TaxID=1230456 RepID=M0PIZ7_9EURY|nr:hypothetical protein [Halorubrum kocurii]EMA70026.1 hypothetical protein C468_00785 [Halorubrum kocurii JCM 14978]